jgi:hypothetical protein
MPPREYHADEIPARDALRQAATAMRTRQGPSSADQRTPLTSTRAVAGAAQPARSNSGPMSIKDQAYSIASGWGPANLQDISGNSDGMVFANRGGGMAVYGGGQTGEMILNPQQTSNAVDWGRSSVIQSIAGGNLPSEPKDLLGTLVKRYSTQINKIFDDALKSSDGSPMSQKVATEMKNIASKTAKGILDAVGDVGLNAGEQHGLKESVYGRSVNMRGLSPLAQEAYLNANPQLAAKVSQMGGLKRLMGGDNTFLGDGSGGGAVFGGGGGSGGGRFGAGGGVWGSPIGRILYGSYLTKRMWSMFAGPVMQNAEAYGKHMAGYEGLYAAEGGDLEGSDANYSYRSSAVQRYFQRGAYEQFGGFSDVMYSKTGGSSGLARGLSGVGLGAGLASVGGVALGMEAMMGGMFGAVAGGLAPVALGAGALIAGGTLGLEAYNTIAQPETPLTWGGIAEDINAKSIKRKAALALGSRQVNSFQASSAGGLFMPVRMPEKSFDEHSEEDLRSVLTRQEQSVVFGTPGNERLEKLMGLTDTVRSITGEDESSSQTAFRQLGRFLPDGVSGEKDLIADLSEWSVGRHMTLNEGVSEISTMARAAGILPGTGQSDDFARMYSGLSSSERLAYQGRLETYNSVAGMLRPYFGSGLEASQFANQHDLGYGSGRVMQSFGNLAQQHGIDLDGTVAYEAPTNGRPQKISLRDQLARRAKVTTPYQAAIDVAMADMFIRSGLDMNTSMAMGSNLGVSSQTDLRAFQSFYNLDEQMVGTPSADRAVQLGGYSQSQSPMQSQQMAGMAPFMTRAGFGDPLEFLSNRNYTDQGLHNLSRAFGGDLKAWSYLSYQYDENDMSNMSGRFYNEGNQPIYQTSGRDFMSFMQGQAQVWGNPVAQNAKSGVDLTSSAANMLGQLLGSSNMEMMQALAQGGATGLTQLHNDKQFGYQSAGAGIQLQQIALRQNHLWGADQGGSWDKPAAGSAWAMQDQMTQLQYQSQMAGFAHSIKRMDTSNEYAVQFEQLERDRMGVNRDHQDWTMGFGRQSSLMRRDWAREDWQYQDQMKGMDFSWAMEDMDEAIRMSSGRERRQLVERKDRMTTKNNLESEQVDKVRGRQEELWNREDERYQRSLEYTDELREKEDERFELSIERRETLFELDREDLQRRISDAKRMHALQLQMQEAQRKFQAEQMELQKASIGVQAAAAREAKEYQEIMLGLKDVYSQTEEAAKNIIQYQPEKHYQALETLAARLGELDPASAKAAEDLMSEIRNVDAGSASAAEGAFLELSNVNISAATSVQDMLMATSEINVGGVYALASLMRQTSSISVGGIGSLAGLIRALNGFSWNDNRGGGDDPVVATTTFANTRTNVNHALNNQNVFID